MDLDLRIARPRCACDQDASIWSLKISPRKISVYQPSSSIRSSVRREGVQRLFIEAVCADSVPLSYSRLLQRLKGASTRGHHLASPMSTVCVPAAEGKIHEQNDLHFLLCRHVPAGRTSVGGLQVQAVSPLRRGPGDGKDLRVSPGRVAAFSLLSRRPVLPHV
jgi:hypothetical protein